MKKKSILKNTFINLFIVMIFLVIVVHISIFFIYKNFYIRNCTRQIDVDMKSIIDILKNTDNYDEVLNSYAKNNRVNICFKIEDKTEYYHGNELLLDFYSENDELIKINGVDGMDSVLFRTKKVVLKNGTPATVQLSMNLQQLKESKSIAVSLLPYSLFISLVFSMVFSYFYSKRLTNPILKMSGTVKQMTDLNQHAEIHINNKDELGVLAEDINDLYKNFLKVIDDYKEKNEEVLHIERERLEFFRGTSHELKTPLAKLSILLESMKYNVGKYKDHDKYLEESLTIVNELSGMISDILDGVKNIKLEEEKIQNILVREQLNKIIDNYQLIAKSKHISLHTEIDGNMELNIPKEECEKVLSNVLSNAIKYGIENSEIQIKLNDEELSIYNAANPIPDEIMQTIWKGQYLLEKSEDIQRSGMGLYIVKTILDQYKIKYSFGPYKEGYIFKIEK